MPTDDSALPLDTRPSLPETPMETPDSERPVSYSSTSSSASSRDSHCSSLAPAFRASSETDPQAGAIRLELVPAQQLECVDPQLERRLEATHGHTQAAMTQAMSEPAAEPAAEPTGPKLQYVDRVVQEILDTERTYVQDLRSIVQDYLGCSASQAQLALGPEEKRALFGNIRDIYRFNSELLQELEKCQADPVAIAERFVAKSEEFHIYTQYCTNYPRSVAVLTECMRNKALAKFFRERQESLNHSLPLGSYLLKPVQRILKYHLLLHEIANHLDKQTDRYEVVQDAIDTMQRVAWHINDMKRKHEHAVRLQEIQSLLMNWKGPDLIGYGELVLEGTFRIQRAKNERTLFLLEKLLLITKKREESYTYKAHIMCCNLMLVEVIPKEPLSFSVFHYKNPKLQHTVQAKSQQDKRTWILHLKRLILENHPAKIPAKAKQAILDMDAVDSTGLSCSPHWDKKTQAKDGPTPRRVRRKTEPLSRLLKNAKQSGTNPDPQKRGSLGVALLSPMSQLSPREGLLASIGRTRSLVSQSQESLDPAEPSDCDDNPHLPEAENGAEPGLVKGKKSKGQGKGTMKRLNPQASVDCIDKWRDCNIGVQDLQAVKDSLQMDPSMSCRTEGLLARPQSPNLAAMISGGHIARNIWTDHKIRRAMFPTRQQTVQGEDEEDLYQMFMPSEPSDPDLVASQEGGSSRGSGRPCSWHMEQTQAPVYTEAPSSSKKVLRRASSVGEKNSKAPDPGEKLGSPRDSLQIDSSSSVSGSAEQLTIDDIENVYDNISYEDLKSMGLICREPESTQYPQVTKEEKQAKKAEQTATSTGMTESRNSSDIYVSPSKDSVPFGTCELKIVEENIYDTIGFLDQPPEPLHSPAVGEQDTMFLQPISTGSNSLDRFLSEDSLQSYEDERQVSVEMDSPSISDSLVHRSPAGTMSEKVDEIWNDLENYIKKNEKKQDRLTAAFPVNGEESPVKSSTQESPIKTTKQESPVKFSKQGSPLKVAKQGSPLKSSKQESPIKTTKQASPVKSSKQESPLKVAKQESMLKSSKQESPIKTSKQESPIKTTKQESPIKTTKQESPMKSSKQESPIKAAKQESMLKSSKQESPIKTSKQESPIKTTKQESPIKTTKQESPMKSSKQESPIKAAKQESSLKSSKQESPIKTTKQDSPLKSSRLGSPVKVTKQENPLKSSKQGRLAQGTSGRRGPGLFREEAIEILEPPVSSSVVVENLGSTKTIKSKLARFSSGSFRLDEPDTLKEKGESPRERALLGLGGGLFPRDFVSFDNTLDSSSSLFPGAMDFSLDFGDKTKNRVYLMARQYSQKIKKANQLLKTKSSEQEHTVSRLKSKQKDLADILEEKKQGGTAIGARIAEYSQLYDQIPFKDMPPGKQNDPENATLEPPCLHSSPSLAPPQGSSESHASDSCVDEDWLNSTYSNGELVDFVSCVNEAALQREGLVSSPEKQLSLVCPIPTIKYSSPPQSPTQRWSACMAQPNKENLSHQHVYNSLDRQTQSAKALPYNRCLSSSSIAASGKNGDHLGGDSVAGLGISLTGGGSWGSAFARLGYSGRQSSLPERYSDLTLQDSQQVVVVVSNSPSSNALRATQNYHANFKDNDDDDDDYVEIKSDDEELEDGRQHKEPLAISTPCVTRAERAGQGPSISLPCTPIRTNPRIPPPAFPDQDSLAHYLWSEPQVSQQNLVQSLRDKFHCLSSSSFA
ncbi:pleckstrin homology domain-containing family G member 1 isoform X2 [Brienomyrus brachyistius]|uniref:pleckstrin homology domain-containing family G member 1 isoform X2 n=1 Tax=Brienomyrus brachyistius TaxID=42636 RepID=UPI0020B3E2B9|nr:pleckstrin homology domain-containing family G member 1 isoform X2 [Brienomyrus brachyistius]